MESNMNTEPNHEAVNEVIANNELTQVELEIVQGGGQAGGQALGQVGGAFGGLFLGLSLIHI